MVAPALRILIRLDTVYLSAILEACKINIENLVGGKKLRQDVRKKNTAYKKHHQ